MKRGKPLKRTPFRRALRKAEAPSVEREPKPYARATVKPLLRGVYAGAVSGEPVEKESAIQSAAYMNAVRSLGYCMHCGVECRPDFCHRDMGKGAGIKTDCREGWPGCRPCHDFIGASGKLRREDKREVELMLGAKTRAAIEAAGMWPASLPRWNA